MIKIIKHFMGNTFNLGDSVIYDGIEKILLRHFNDINILKIHITNSLKWQNFKGINKETLDFIKKPDIIIIGGHPLIGEKELIEIDKNVNIEEMPIFLMGVGSYFKLEEPNITKDYLTYSEYLFSKMRAISVRDIETYNYLSQFNDNIYLTGDPGLYLYEKEFKYNDSDYVLIVFRGSELNSIFYETLIDRIKQLGLKVFLIAHDPKEINQITEIANKCKCYYLCSPNYKYYVPFYENARFVVSFRHHGNILSLTLGTPFINVYYNTIGENVKNMYDPESQFSVYNPTSYKAKKRIKIMDKIKGRIGENLRKYKRKLIKEQELMITDIITIACRIMQKQIDYTYCYNKIKQQKEEMLKFIEQIKKVEENK